MIYGYKCRTCGREVDSPHRADTLGPCATLEQKDFGFNCPGEMRRLFSVRTERPMQEHYNATTNSMIRTNRQFDEEMKRQTDIQSARIGMDVKYERIDPSDKAALGVTDEGMAATNNARKKQGLPTFKL